MIGLGNDKKSALKLTLHIDDRSPFAISAIWAVKADNLEVLPKLIIIRAAKYLA